MKNDYCLLLCLTSNSFPLSLTVLSSVMDYAGAGLSSSSNGSRGAGGGDFGGPRGGGRVRLGSGGAGLLLFGSVLR